LEYADVSEVRTASFIALMNMKAVLTSETSGYSNDTTWRYGSEESNLLVVLFLLLRNATMLLPLASWADFLILDGSSYCGAEI
jgi:hypothetical protein